MKRKDKKMKLTVKDSFEVYRSIRKPTLKSGFPFKSKKEYNRNKKIEEE